jgi:hypothetical protein
LNPKVLALMGSDPGVVSLYIGTRDSGGGDLLVPRGKWVEHLKRIETHLGDVGAHDYHPEIVQHWRRHHR